MSIKGSLRWTRDEDLWSRRRCEREKAAAFAANKGMTVAPNDDDMTDPDARPTARKPATRLYAGAQAGTGGLEGDIPSAH